MKAPTPHFFCENCGAEVPLNAKTCPQCGRTFSSVRCPACNFAGEEALFAGGCPVCGFTAEQQTTDRRSTDRRSADRRSAGKGRQTGGRGTEVEALPLWVYVVSGIILLGMFAVILSWLF